MLTTYNIDNRTGIEKRTHSDTHTPTDGKGTRTTTKAHCRTSSNCILG